MKRLHLLCLPVLCMVLLLIQACKNQPEVKEAAREKETELSPTQVPLRPADPASEELLRQAAYGGNKSEVTRLLEQGVAIYGDDAASFASQSGHDHVVKYLCQLD